MEALTTLRSRTVILPIRDIDTDQIIPARFLTTTTREGLGEALFQDLRYDRDGAERADFPLNDPAVRDCEILVAGNNFGCGSSREHAVWALRGGGFQAVVSTEFADIFRGNALKNGLVPVLVDEATHARLIEAPGTEATVDIDAKSLSFGSRRAQFPLEPFAQYCLLNGLDELAFLLEREKDIAAFEVASGPTPWSV